jgi:hypothetical protein
MLWTFRACNCNGMIVGTKRNKTTLETFPMMALGLENISKTAN